MHMNECSPFASCLQEHDLSASPLPAGPNNLTVWHWMHCVLRNMHASCLYAMQSIIIMDHVIIQLPMHFDRSRVPFCDSISLWICMQRQGIHAKLPWLSSRVRTLPQLATFKSILSSPVCIVSPSAPMMIDET